MLVNKMYKYKFRMYGTLLYFEGRGSTSVIFAQYIMLERIDPIQNE